MLFNRRLIHYIIRYVIPSKTLCCNISFVHTNLMVEIMTNHLAIQTRKLVFFGFIRAIWRKRLGFSHCYCLWECYNMFFTFFHSNLWLLENSGNVLFCYRHWHYIWRMRRNIFRYIKSKPNGRSFNLILKYGLFAMSRYTTAISFFMAGYIVWVYCSVSIIFKTI